MCLVVSHFEVFFWILTLYKWMDSLNEECIYNIRCVPGNVIDSITFKRMIYLINFKGDVSIGKYSIIDF